ncbi:thermonuclease family protein [Akkermansiaceae bacterium]|nr:thermonuclease family protein [Akkermansiaceae bacterium]
MSRNRNRGGNRGRGSRFNARSIFRMIPRRLLYAGVLAVIGWMKFGEIGSDKKREGSVRDESVIINQPGSSDQAASSQLTPVSVSSSKFEILENCSIIDHRGNDGDSFHVKTSKGDQELRLYFVDAPESAARSYGGGENNHERIAQQGAAMGGLSQKQTTEVGVEAKQFVKSLLKGKKFRVATVWESVYGSRRNYAFILVSYEGQERYLHELIVARGLGRIHTKPHTLPDNTSASRHKDRLYKLEKYAKQKGYGAWGL